MLDFNRELQKLVNDFPQIPAREQSDVSAAFSALDEHVLRLLKKQSEMGIQVQELYEALEESARTASEAEREQSKLLDALITAADLIEDFFMYYQEHYDEALSPQSAMMRSALGGAMAAAGLTRIADERAPLDSALSTVDQVEADASLPRGWIVRVLRPGYMYKGAVLRKARVITNKPKDSGV